MRKIFLLLIISLLILGCANNNLPANESTDDNNGLDVPDNTQDTTDTEPDEVIPDVEPVPNIFIDASTPSGPYNEGDEFDIEYTVENIGDTIKGYIVSVCEKAGFEAKCRTKTVKDIGTHNSSLVNCDFTEEDAICDEETLGTNGIYTYSVLVYDCADLEDATDMDCSEVEKSAIPESVEPLKTFEKEIEVGGESNDDEDSDTDSDSGTTQGAITDFRTIDPNWKCNFIMDSEDPTDIWRYSKLDTDISIACGKAILIQETVNQPLRPVYNISFNYSDTFSAQYAGNGEIIISHLGTAQSAFKDVLIHELTHSALDEIPLPVWFEEGIAERMVDLVNEQDTSLWRVYIKDIETLDPFDTGDGVDNSINYRYANYTVKKFVEKYGYDALRETIQFVKDEQEWGNINKRNQVLVNAAIDATGDSSITLDKLAYPKNYE
ncbi:MAG: hypothetical protein V1672_04330 [Candidatus Diapherotrites archaeon]